MSEEPQSFDLRDAQPDRDVRAQRELADRIREQIIASWRAPKLNPNASGNIDFVLRAAADELEKFLAEETRDDGA